MTGSDIRFDNLHVHKAITDQTAVTNCTSVNYNYLHKNLFAQLSITRKSLQMADCCEVSSKKYRNRLFCLFRSCLIRSFSLSIRTRHWILSSTQRFSSTSAAYRYRQAIDIAHTSIDLLKVSLHYAKLLQAQTYQKPKNASLYLFQRSKHSHAWQ